MTPAPALLGDFAELLSYPSTDPTPAARRCRVRVSAKAAPHLDAFLRRAEGARPHELEEDYSSAFDLDPACPPYVGYHLFGDDARRGEFMARLCDVYRAGGFAPPAGELPDHLAVVLRFLAACPGGDAREDLLIDGLRPALDKMLSTPPDSSNAYGPLLAALREELA